MNRSKTLGCIFLVAGTTIGAGMLAIPLALSGLGFISSVVLLLLMWALMTYTALLIIEVSLACGVEASFHSLAQKTLGKTGVVITNASTLFLFYALIAAYTSGGANFLVEHGQAWGLDISYSQSALLFIGVFGSLIALGIHKVDLANRGLFLVKLVLLVLLLGFLLPMVDTTNLLARPLEQALVVAGIPIVFAAFGFHGSAPSIIRYLGPNPRVLRVVFMVGAGIPLCVYLLWLYGIQGNIEQAALLTFAREANALPAMFDAIGATSAHGSLGGLLKLFADLALTTSFLGVGIGLFDLLQDSCRRGSDCLGRAQTTVLTFAPPTLIALFYPQGFIQALGFAAIALSILAVLLPVAMVLRIRGRATMQSSYQVAGGRFALCVVALAGIAVIVVQCLVALGFLSGV